MVTVPLLELPLDLDRWDCNIRSVLCDSDESLREGLALDALCTDFRTELDPRKTAPVTGELMPQAAEAAMAM